MFEIGFSELLLVAVIGLLVLGPERLPTAIRTASLWIGRIRRQFHEIKTEVEREIGADEIRAQLRNEAIMDELRQSRDALQSSVHELGSDVTATSTPPTLPTATTTAASTPATDGDGKSA
ncbi:MAG: twin-arginine translocase subunit TatB [Pseudomonadales bacterium]|nr:twin-arginine translocase subunit TatB [Pseudomonadales bacterium]MCP5322219.1 twin-arginine translocase subunit TatB [Pseudomonadales bacterium]MCP5337105.1 twin-arginine translocase subunit TatB [Pseudomonadales bacterium]